MRYSLLNFAACPETGSELVCLVIREKYAPLSHVRMSACSRMNQPGALVGPLPASAPRNRITEVLGRHACAPSDDDFRVRHWRIEQGILVAPDTGRWYPIRDFIPELLPDHLRDRGRDREWLTGMRPELPPDIFDLLIAQTFPNADRRESDPGISYKSAEMSILSKIGDDPDFFFPGLLSPFNPGALHHTLDLLRMFANCMHLLHNDRRRFILDSGCGYAWTTDWMWKSGFEPVGMDISRVYLEIAAKRLGDELPYVLVGDTENLPIRDEVLDGVLGFDAFHHIPNRNRAMNEFFRVMRPNGLVVLAEPPGEHEHVPEVQDIMTKYGTLEKGMDLADVREYVRDSGLEQPVQHHIVNLGEADLGAKVTSSLLEKRSFSQANLFTILKKQSMLSRIKAAVEKTFA